MSGTITHYWDGTRLVVTSDSGTSSCDLKGDKGDMGVRGCQGKPGILTDTTGALLADAENYYTKEEADATTNTLTSEVDQLNQDVKNLKAMSVKTAVGQEISSTYASQVTAGGADIVNGTDTTVGLIKGSTKRCENLLVYPYSTTSNTTSNGITWTFDEQGVITVNGTSTAISGYYLMNSRTVLNKAGTYTISLINGSTSYYLEISGRMNDEANTWVWGKQVFGNAVTFTLNEGEYLIVQARVASGVTAKNQKLYVMLNEGETALNWQPYFTDLKHAKIDSIVSTGSNLLDMSKLVGNSLADNGDGTYTFTKNGNDRWGATWTLDTPISGGGMYLRTDIIENTTGKTVISAEFYDEYGKRLTAGFKNEWTGYTFVNADRKLVKMRLYLDATANDDSYIKFKNPIIVRAALGTNAEYTPFIQETYQLPETLELGEWDSFNPQTGEITRGTGRYEITGEEGWTLNTTFNRFEATLPTAGTLDKGSTTPILDVVCSHFSTTPNTSADAYGVWLMGYTSNQVKMRIIDARFTTAAELTTYLQEQYANGTPVTIEYILATPTIKTLANAPAGYTVWNQGNEAIVNENDVYGAMPTVTQEYYVWLEV